MASTIASKSAALLMQTIRCCVFVGCGIVALTCHAGTAKDKISSGSFGAADVQINSRYTITFPDASIMHYTGDVAGLKATAPDGSARFDITRPEVIAYRKYLQKTQTQHINEIQSVLKRQLKIYQKYDLTISGIATDLTAQEADAIKAWLGFSFSRDIYYTLDSFRGPTFTGANTVWNGNSTPNHIPHVGAGMTIGVLDTGYNSAHPSFGVMPPVCNGDFYGPFLKVRSARDCTRSGCPDAAAGGDPRDTDGHGSHTASIAAGTTLTNTLVNTQTSMSWAPVPIFPAGFAQMSGVAPCAQLRIYKVCDDGGACSDSDVRAGQEAAISDAVDVINFSIGSGSHPWWTAGDNERGFLDAFNAGIVVVASAGNTGAVDNPFGQVHHLGPWVMSVAASSHDHVDVLNGIISAVGPGKPPANTQNIALSPSDVPAAISRMSRATLRYAPSNLGGCTTAGVAPGYFRGAIALLRRGECSIVEQIDNATAAGAIAIIFYGTRTAPYYFYASGAVSTIPIYTVLLTDANALIAYLAANSASITINLTPPRAQGNVLANYSLRGPNSSFDVTKPDIAAPGTQIYAAYIASRDPREPVVPNNYAYLSGTSMASPHVAGAAALVREAHPDWRPAEVMSALRLTAFESGTEEDGSIPWNPDDVGNGRVDLTQATRAGLVMDETYAHFRDANPAAEGDPRTLNLPALRNSNCLTTCTWTRTVRSGLSTSAAWVVSSFDTPNAVITVSPMAFTLAPRGASGDSATLTITANIRTPTAPVRIGFSDILLHSISDASLPDEHITVAVQSPH